MSNNTSVLHSMLIQNQYFQELPKDKQLVFAKLAPLFEKLKHRATEGPNKGQVLSAVYLTPEELHDSLNVGNVENWQEFLSLDVVQQYIKAQLASDAQVAQRKMLPTLYRQAQTGDAQSQKMLNDLSGVLNSGERNKVIVLHHIPRPVKPEKPKQPVN